MGKILSNAAFLAAEQQIGAIHSIETLSYTNNIVCGVTTSKGMFVVKEIVDPTVDAFQEKRIIDMFPSEFLFRPILHVQKVGNERNSIVIAPYLEGDSFDVILSSGNYSRKEARQWATDLDRMFRLLNTVPAQGFGRPSNHRPPGYISWTSFLDWYLESQRMKAPRLAVMRYGILRNVFERLIPLLNEQTKSPVLFTADVNARNFLIDYPNRRLRLIHMPVVWHGDPAVPYGEMMIHLHNTPMAADLLELGCFPMWRIHFYAAFSAYVILAFVERFEPTPLEDAISWGGSSPLLRLLDENLEKLLGKNLGIGDSPPCL